MKVLKFGAVWCTTCLVMKPRWAEIEKENPWLETEYIDADENPEEVERYKVTDFPTFVFLDKSGGEIKRLTGEISKKEILELIEELKDR